MSSLTPAFSRRRTLGLLGASPFLLQAGFGHAAAPDFAALLREALAQAAFTVQPARFELVRFDRFGEAPGAQLSAVVGLHWPPGHRQRKVTASGPSDMAAFETLLTRIEAEFSALG